MDRTAGPDQGSTRGETPGSSPEDARGRRAALARYLADLLPDGQRPVVVSNRGPLSFEQQGGDWRAQRGSGGLVTALAELGRLAPVSWVSAAAEPGNIAAGNALRGTGPDGDRLRQLVAEQMPDQDLELALTEVPSDAYDLHYGTISNPFLWFLQHEMYSLPYGPNVDDDLIHAWRKGYRVVNELLGRAAVEAAGPLRPVVLLQDYHLYLAATTIRAARPDALLLHFNHIPWPAASTWQMLPQRLRRAIAEGLLANDVLGFQTTRYARQFLDSIPNCVDDARVDRAGRAVHWRGRTIHVRSYPISLEPDALVRFAKSEPVRARREQLEERLERAGRPRLIVRVDRLEPSKNVLRGFLAFEALLKRRPDLRGSVRFLAIQSISRGGLQEYADYASAVREVVARVNGLADPDQAPIWLLDGSDYELAVAAMQLAQVMLVNPVIDGMNLVAKESVLVGRPVLILSETAGAAEQLGGDSLTVAAADIAGTSEAMERALQMEPQERDRHLRRLRASVRGEDIGWWLGRQLRDLAAIGEGRRPP